MRVLFVVALGFLSACHASEQTSDAADYNITFYTKTPHIGHATLRLPNTQNSDRTLYLRGNMMDVPSQLSDVACGGHEIAQNEDLTWSVPDTCHTVSWTINLSTQDTSSFQPSQQQSLFTDPNWWLISGPSSILRLSGEDTEIKQIGFTLPDNMRVAYQLQNVNNPPNYYNFGTVPSRSVRNETDALTYIGDDLDAVLSIVSPKDHLKAIAYFRSFLGTSARRVDRLDVVWFGAPRERREASGAAGYDTILANYIISKDAPKREEQLLSLMLVLHEQFHQLDSGSHPIWIGESLANYYALKALLEIYPNDMAAISVWDRFIDVDRPVDISLTQIQSEISTDGNRQNYGLLYTQGASFWHELDMALQANSSGLTGLDDYILKIMELDLNANENAWDIIKPLFTALPASTLNTLEQKYIYG